MSSTHRLGVGRVFPVDWWPDQGLNIRWDSPVAVWDQSALCDGSTVNSIKHPQRSAALHILHRSKVNRKWSQLASHAHGEEVTRSINMRLSPNQLIDRRVSAALLQTSRTDVMWLEQGGIRVQIPECPSPLKSMTVNKDPVRLKQARDHQCHHWGALEQGTAVLGSSRGECVGLFLRKGVGLWIKEATGTYPEDGGAVWGAAEDAAVVEAESSGGDGVAVTSQHLHWNLKTRERTTALMYMLTHANTC